MKIALVGPTDRSIWTFRRGLIEALLARGHSVHVLCSDGPYAGRITSLGAIHIATPISRFVNPMADLRYLRHLYQTFRRECYDLVHNFTIKPNVYGAMMARLAGIKTVVALVEGLGFGYPEEPGVKAWFSRSLFLILYRIGCRLTDRVWFINRDDMALFREKGLVSDSQAVFIRSVGVRLDDYSPELVDPEVLNDLRQLLGDWRYVVMVGRMVWSKGVREYVDAARLLAEEFPDVRFLLVGGNDPGSPQSVPEAYLERVSSESNVRWLGFRQDVSALLALSEIVVLPTYYREGVPRILLEAMAMGKPLVASDYVGCREVVEPGKNGYLVPIKDPEALADAVGRLLRDESLRRAFGQEGYCRIQSEYDEPLIVERVLATLYRLGETK